MTTPCRADCPSGDCAGCTFPPRRTSLKTRQAQLRAFEAQRQQEREFAFEMPWGEDAAFGDQAPARAPEAA